MLFFKAGNWGDWTQFSSCTVTCNGGIETRTRSCNNPSPELPGKDCYGEGTEIRACNDSPCPTGKHEYYFSIFRLCFRKDIEIIACSQP